MPPRFPPRSVEVHSKNPGATTQNSQFPSLLQRKKNPHSSCCSSYLEMNRKKTIRTSSITLSWKYGLSRTVNLQLISAIFHSIVRVKIQTDYLYMAMNKAISFDICSIFDRGSINCKINIHYTKVFQLEFGQNTTYDTHFTYIQTINLGVQIRWLK